MPTCLIGVDHVVDRSYHDKYDGQDDEIAERFGTREADDQHKVDQVEGALHGSLDTVEHPSLRVLHILLEELTGDQVKGPQAYVVERERQTNQQADG